jgi:genetic interactor of prohibitins 3, mitochondrial
MVGKVNVGKSNLFEAVFPKGRSERGKYSILETVAGEAVQTSQGLVEEPGPSIFDYRGSEEDFGRKTPLNEASLLPPAQPETAFPVMPIVSSLPGTTASPIRLPFKKGRGELIDLPGLSRGNLASYVCEENQAELVMCRRLKPKQHVLKPGQSLLLGGLIRITPTTSNLSFLACAFVPFHEHVTSTEKAVGIQTQQRESGVPSIAKPGTGEKVASAGKFKLKWDVTKHRAGPITSPAAIGLKVEKLPYRILSTDILIEGCGWVEVVAQVRKKQLEQGIASDPDDGMTNGNGFGEGEDIYPEVEVFSPGGGGIGARMPMNAWMMGVGSKKLVKRKRPRQSMKGAKKREKLQRREK